MMPVKLDSESLYVFVFGPGFGESIAVRIPPDRWMVIDSCRVGGKAAALHLLDKYDGHHCECLVLTHRHQDHYSGFADLINYGTWVTIGCNNLTLYEEFRLARDLEVRLTGELEQVISSINTSWEKSPETEWWTWRNSERNVGDAIARVLQPPEEFARQFKGTKWNHLSSAILLTWKNSTLLLGADVPTPHWADICDATTQANLHQIMKVPHHGSDEAMDDGYLLGTRDRLWIVTPYSRGEKVPSFDDDRGVHRMLTHVDAIYMTGLPEAHDKQHQTPCNATRRDLSQKADPSPSVFTLPGGISGTVAPTRSDISCYVIARIDPSGVAGIVGCGPGSVRVTENAIGVPHD